MQNLQLTHKIELPELPVDTVSVTELPTELPENIGNSVGNSQTLAQSGGNSGNSISSPFAEVCNLLSQLTDSERQKLVEMLTQPKTVEAKKGLRVRYIGTKYAEQLAGLELVVDAISKYKEITCLKPDGSFTTWLNPKDLEVAD
ncbi:hypothetical protein [Microcoleus vaginatus]|uniref:hypothetical protein n=1 Tax=Microcoleus vaginatus TaxID=119532 RepID=UPI001F60A94D|nr:hypothetical protein D0A37_02645 [Microcoleus vaginatus HSN003]